MSSTLEAAEAMLATVESGRARVRELAHRSLPFNRALDLDIQGRVGSSPERVLLEMRHAPLDLAILTAATSRARLAMSLEDAEPAPPVAPRSQPPAAHRQEAPTANQEPVSPSAVEPSAAPGDEEAPSDQVQTIVARPDAELARALGREPEAQEADAPASADAPSDARISDARISDAPISDDLDLDELVHDDLPATAQEDLQTVRDEASVSDESPPQAGVSTDRSEEPEEDPELQEQTVLRPSPFSQRGEATAESLGAPRAAAAPRASVPDPAQVEGEVAAATVPEEEEDTAVFGSAESEPTNVAPMSPELLAAISQPRSQEPGGMDSSDGWDEVARPDALQDDDEEPEVTEIADYGDYETPQLIEHDKDALEEPTAAAAVQLLGDGKARTLTPTLELGDADTGEISSAPDLKDGDESRLNVSFEEPEEEEETGSVIPELTAGADMPEHSSVVITRDGLHHVDGAAVADADISEEELQTYIEDATAAEQRGNLQQAVVHLGDLLSMVPSHVSAHLRRGRCLVELGDYAAAMSDFQRAEDLVPSSPEPIFEMGNLFYARKEYRKAISYFDQAIEMAPEHAMAWCRRGMCHQFRKNHAQAFKDLQKALSLDPEIPNLRKYVQSARKAMQRSSRR